MPQCQQIMPALHFLQEHDIGLQGIDPQLERMHARTAPDGTDAFMNIVGCYAQFHRVQVY